MTIYDLQVGDWVNVRQFPHGKNLIPVRVSSLAGGDLNSRGEGVVDVLVPRVTEGQVISSRTSDNCYPIPITKEILDKNGFDVRDSSEAKFLVDEGNTTVTNITIKFHQGDMILLLRVYDQYQRVEMKIQYVHELQQAMRLLKVNKDIVL
jgi:hypothetical protein